VSKSLYLTPRFGLSFTPPDANLTAPAAYDEYVSDPAKPVPYQPRPVRFADSDAWRRWLLVDQRAYADRTDVLVYQTPPLTEPVRIAGTPVVNLVASTSGTDSDWVVKLIDVYPDDVPSQPEMGGSLGLPWTSSEAAIERASRRRHPSNQTRRCRTGLRFPRPTMPF
jgi:predicted acyl esterase